MLFFLFDYVFIWQWVQARVTGQFGESFGF